MSHEPKPVINREFEIEQPDEGAIVDPMAWYDSPGPWELEIGCGKGSFLLSRARDNPHIRMLGIEWANKYYRYTVDRMARWQQTNVRVMRTDAKIFVMRHLPPKCLDALHIYHPDPWPKKRHHKRRLIQTDFADAVSALLKPGAVWHLQTDHREYADQMQDVLCQRTDLEQQHDQSIANVAGPEWEGTNFQIKYAREGRPIYHFAFKRK